MFGELDNSLWFFVIIIVVSWRISGFVMIIGKEKIIKNNSFLVNIVVGFGLLEKFRG